MWSNLGRWIFKRYHLLSVYISQLISESQKKKINTSWMVLIRSPSVTGVCLYRPVCLHQQPKLAAEVGTGAFSGLGLVQLALNISYKIYMASSKGRKKIS